VRLRWKIGPASYVETYEHRLAAGVPSTLDLAEQFHLSAGNVSRALRECGVRPRARPGHPALDQARQGVHARDGMRCWRCGRSAVWSSPHVHHRKLRSQGGRDAPSNLLLLCGDCHGWVHGHPRLARLAGWIVSRSSTPADVPAWCEPLAGWYRLDDDYGRHRADNGVPAPVEALCR